MKTLQQDRSKSVLMPEAHGVVRPFLHEHKKCKKKKTKKDMAHLKKYLCIEASRETEVVGHVQSKE